MDHRRRIRVLEKLANIYNTKVLDIYNAHVPFGMEPVTAQGIGSSTAKLGPVTRPTTGKDMDDFKARRASHRANLNDYVDSWRESRQAPSWIAARPAPLVTDPSIPAAGKQVAIKPPTPPKPNIPPKQPALSASEARYRASVEDN